MYEPCCPSVHQFHHHLEAAGLISSIFLLEPRKLGENFTSNMVLNELMWSNNILSWSSSIAIINVALNKWSTIARIMQTSRVFAQHVTYTAINTCDICPWKQTAQIRKAAHDLNFVLFYKPKLTAVIKPTGWLAKVPLKFLRARIWCKLVYSQQK